MGDKGGSSSPQTQTSTSSPPPQVVAEYQALVNRATANANVPYQAYQGEQVAPLTPQTMQGLEGVNQYANAAQPWIQEAGQQTLDNSQAVTPTAWSGSQVQQYENPYTQDVVNATQNQFNNQNQQQAQFLNSNNISSGAFGGNRAGISQAILANQQQTAQAPVIAGLNQANYNQATQEFNNQQQTGLQAGLASEQLGQAGAAQLGQLGTTSQQAGLQGATAQTQAGTIPQAQQQAIDTAIMNQYMTGQAYPFQTTGWLGNIIEGIGSQSGGSSTTTAPGPSSTSQGVGAAVSALGGLASFFSDKRMKENIEPIGKTFDGQKIYRYNYKGDPRSQIGLIAQDVEKKHPESVSKAGLGSLKGMRMVDYDKATEDSAKRGHFDTGGMVRPHFDPGGFVSSQSPITGIPSPYSADPFVDFDVTEAIGSGVGAPDPASGIAGNLYWQQTQGGTGKGGAQTLPAGKTQTLRPLSPTKFTMSPWDQAAGSAYQGYDLHNPGTGAAAVAPTMPAKASGGGIDPNASDDEMTGPSTYQGMYGSAPGASLLNPSGNGQMLWDEWGGFTGPSGAIANDAALHGQPTGGNALMTPGSFIGLGGKKQAPTVNAPMAQPGPPALQGYTLGTASPGGAALAPSMGSAWAGLPSSGSPDNMYAPARAPGFSAGGMIGQTGIGAATHGEGLAGLSAKEGFGGAYGRPGFAGGGQPGGEEAPPDPWGQALTYIPQINLPRGNTIPPPPHAGGQGGGGGGDTGGDLGKSLGSLGKMAKDKLGGLGGDIPDPDFGAGDLSGDMINPDDFSLGVDMGGGFGGLARGGRARQHFDIGGDALPDNAAPSPFVFDPNDTEDMHMPGGPKYAGPDPDAHPYVDAEGHYQSMGVGEKASPGAKVAPIVPKAPIQLPVRAPTAPPAADDSGEDTWGRMIRQESGGRQFRPDGRTVTSPVGALGIAQVMPGTGPEAAALAGLPWDPGRLSNDEAYNKALGHAYYQKQLETFGNPAMAAAAYNAGPGAVQRAVAKAGGPGGDWISHLPAETQNYVAVTTRGSPASDAIASSSPGSGTLGGGSGSSGLGAAARGNPANMPSEDAETVQSDGPPGGGTDWGKKFQDIGPSLMSAGFGMMAARSPWAMTNIGEGAQQGVQFYQKQHQLDREWQKTQAEIENLGSEAGARTAEVGLKTRQLDLEAAKFGLQIQQMKSIDRALNDDAPTGAAANSVSPPPVAGAHPASAPMPLTRPQGGQPAQGAAPTAGSAPNPAVDTDLPGPNHVPNWGPAHAGSASGPVVADPGWTPPGAAPTQGAAPPQAIVQAAQPQSPQEGDFFQGVPKMQNPLVLMRLAAATAAFNPEASAKYATMAESVMNRGAVLKGGQMTPLPGWVQFQAQQEQAKAAGKVAGETSPQAVAGRGAISEAEAAGKVAGETSVPAIQSKAALAGAEQQAKSAAEAQYKIVDVPMMNGGVKQMTADKAAKFLGSPQAVEQAAGKPPEYVQAVQKGLWEDQSKQAEQYQARQEVEQRLGAMQGLMQSLHTGAFATDKAKVWAALRSAGIDVPDTAMANPAAAEEFGKHQMANVFDQAKAVGTRVMVSELQMLSQANANANLQPEANAAILTRALGIAKRDDQHYQDYTDWHRAHPDAIDTSQFEVDWNKANPVSKYVEKEAKDFTYKGQALGKEDNQLYTLPNGTKARYSAKWKGYVPEAAQ